MMSESALDRVARALDLIPFLASNPGLSIVEIAEQFSTTPTQISKDLSLLHMCGLPGYSHLELLDIDYQDPHYVSVTDPQVLDKPRALTHIETLALVMGLTMLEGLTNDQQERENIARFRKRLSFMLEESEINISPAMGLAMLSTEQAVSESPYALILAQAIAAGSATEIEYISATSDTKTHRVIYPQRLFFQGGVGYCEAFSDDGQSSRTFRLDRMTSINATDRVSPEHGNSDLGNSDLGNSDQSSDHHSLSESGASEISPALKTLKTSPTHEFQIVIPKEGFSFLENHSEVITSAHFDGINYDLVLQVQSGEWLLRTLIALPYPAAIIGPAEFAVTFSTRLERTAENYKNREN
jgi:proteasome accessory factor C